MYFMWACRQGRRSEAFPIIILEGSETVFGIFETGVQEGVRKEPKHGEGGGQAPGVFLEFYAKVFLDF